MTTPGPVPSIWDSRTLDPSAVLLTDRVAVVTGAAQGIGKVAGALSQPGDGICVAHGA